MLILLIIDNERNRNEWEIFYNLLLFNISFIKSFFKLVNNIKKTI